MKRNYLPIGKDPKFNHYHSVIDKLILASQIFNSDTHPNEYMKLWDRDTMKNFIYENEGDKDGVYFVKGTAHIATIPFCKLRIKEINEQWDSMCKRTIREGRKALEEWPQNLLNERLEYEAKLLVLQEEVFQVKKALEEFSVKDQVTEDRNVLKNGPRGSGRLSGGILIELDGMKVSISKTGIPFIDDPRAKQYNFYSTADYITHVVKPWALKRAELMKQTRERVAKGEVKFEQVPKGLKDGSSAPWPTMPANCKNYKTK